MHWLMIQDSRRTVRKNYESFVVFCDRCFELDLSEYLLRMASSGGGKIRNKRSRSSNKPYQRPKSILSKVTETVAGLVVPTWLKGMLGGNSSDEVPSEEAAQALDHDTPSTSYESDYPPVGRQQPYPEENDGDEVEDPLPRKGLPSFANAAPPRTTPLPFPSYQQPLQTSTPNENEPSVYQSAAKVGDDDADSSLSTSGCSSIQPHVDRTDHKEKMVKGYLEQYPGRGPSSSSNTPSGPGLWSETSTASLEMRGHRQGGPKPQPAAKRPRFNASYFGTPRPDTTMTPQERHQSSFYAGRTTYGGSSFYRSPATSKKYNPSPYQVHLPVKRHIRPKPAIKKTMDPDFTVTSNTAMKILNTLDRMSTPLSDAKRIPVTPTPSPFAFKPRRVAASERRKTAGPPASGLQVGSQARVVPNTQPPISSRIPPVSAQEPTPSTSGAPKVSDPKSDRFPESYPVSLGQSSAPDRPLTFPPSSPPKSGGKMKTKSRNTLHYSASKDEEDQFVEIPDLPNVALPISAKSMPTFNFFGNVHPKKDLPKTTVEPPANNHVTNGDHRAPLAASEPISKPPVPRTTANADLKMTSAKSTPTPVRTLGNPHSTPLMTSTPFPASSGPATQFRFTSPVVRECAKEGFKFSAPEVKGPPAEHGVRPQTGEQFTFSAPRTKDAGATPTEDKKEGFTFSKPSTADYESTAEGETPTGGVKIAKSLKSGSCLQALGLGTSKSGSATAGSSTSTSSSTPSLMDKFKPAPGSWECDTCMVRNNKTAHRCVACTALKPGGATTASQQTPSSAGFSLAEKFKPAPGSWECDTCLIRNKEDSSKCVACQSAKPGSNSESSNTGRTNKADAAKCVACEAPEPGADDASKPSSEGSRMSLAEMFKPPEGSWTCDTCMIQNEAKDFKCLACQSSKPGAPSSTTNNVSHSTGSSIPHSSEPATTLTLVRSNNTEGTPNASSSKPSLSEMFKAEAGSWECDTCMVRNKPGTSRCVACQSPRPGSEPSLSAPPASSFKFGASSTSSDCATTTSLSSGGFKFGSSTSEVKPTMGGFQFGSFASSSGKDSQSPTVSSKPGAVSSTGGLSLAFLTENHSSGSDAVKPSVSTPGEDKYPLTGGLKFQTKSTEKSDEKGGSSSLFSFGAASSTEDDKDSGITGTKTAESDVSKSKSGFQFGASVKPSEESKQSLNVNPFQNSSATAAATMNAKDPKPGFTFGASSSSDPESSASLSGQTLATSSAAPANNIGLFQFGASSNTKVETAVVKPGKRKDPEPSSTSQTDAGGNGGFKPTFNFVGAGADSDSGKPAVKFGRPAPAEEPKAAFRFGANQASVGGAPQVNATTPFQFGAKPPATAADQSVPNKTSFAFGSKSQQSQVPASQTSGFQFGAVSSSSQNAKPAEKPFAFGAAAPTAQAAASPFTAPTSTPVSTFGAGSSVFGAPLTASAPSGAFGTKPTSQQNPTLSFGGATTPQQNSFGSAPNAFGQGMTNSAPAFGSGSMPSFGSSAPAFGAANSAGANNSAFGAETKAAPTFQFGQNNNNTPSTGTFAFGAASNPPPNQTAPAPVKGFSFNASQAPTFNFGAAPTTNQPTFQFSAPPKPAEGNPFNASAPPSGRKIKKAIRRTGRKT